MQIRETDEIRPLLIHSTTAATNVTNSYEFCQ